MVSIFIPEFIILVVYEMRVLSTRVSSDWVSELMSEIEKGDEESKENASQMEERELRALCVAIAED